VAVVITACVITAAMKISTVISTLMNDVRPTLVGAVVPVVIGAVISILVAPVVRIMISPGIISSGAGNMSVIVIVSSLGRSNYRYRQK
jgi:hypothetical protein